MKLFYIPLTRSNRPRWLLEELGVPYQLVRLDRAKSENQGPAYLAVNPTGKVPALIDGEVRIFESAAIVLYLADKYPEKGLCPPLGTEARARYYQWALYAATTLETPVADTAHHSAMRPEALRVPSIAEEGRADFARVVKAAEDQLGKTPFILGESFSAADVLLGATLTWARMVRLLDGHPHSKAYLERMMARPAYQRSRAD